MTVRSRPHVAFARPEDAIDALQRLYAEAIAALRDALDRYFDHAAPPSREERALFRYPELRVTYHPEGVTPTNRRAFAKFPTAGVYTTTITQPAA
ncbi:MAG: AMP nucleosidase, partial [Methylobacteriaceae bacterium]|nr:AMP nucleosidase [Methylobacteriaceae bacterium]